MSILEEICIRKRKHVEEKKARLSLDEVKAHLKDAETPRGFMGALKAKLAPAIIAEIKKASPSRGVIRENFNPVEIAKIYEEHGAACISVLTDEPYFQGKDQYLLDVKNATTLPVLRKDFMIDIYQIYESRMLGADCVLLIMAALGDNEARKFHDEAQDLDMDVLVEVHDEAELERAAKLGARMVGVNNRNLKTLAVDVQTSHDLLPMIPEGALKITESGLSSNEAVQGLVNAGYHGFLIGEGLVREENIGDALKELSRE